MADEDTRGIWLRRADAVTRKTTRKTAQLLVIAAIYLLSELLIWGISRLLSGVRCEFFSSIIGMVIVFVVTSVLYSQVPVVDGMYRAHVKPLVDWINGQMGVGFVIPLIMLDPEDILSGAEIGQIIANFILTNVVFWLLTFYVSLWILKGTMLVVDIIKAKIEARKAADATQRPLRAPEPPSPTELNVLPRWGSVTSSFTMVKDKDQEKPTETKASSGSEESDKTSDQSSSSNRIINWNKISLQYPSILSFFLIFAVGAPVAAGTGDSRVLDGLATWFFWISAVRGQRLFKQSKLFPKNPRYKSAISTLLNPVLMTVFLLLAYTRAKASALGVTVKWVLDEFSKGSPLYELWTAGVTDEVIVSNPTSYFGAGDLALSILEVGILIWGFKLYECRRQLFSTAGIVTVLISTLAAATNVFVCVLLGVALKLKTPEALAFAARSTTLALAKPAIEAVGGNVPANAGLVVANGILGQLIYPFALSRVGVKREAKENKVESNNGAKAKALLNQGPGETERPASPPPSPIATDHEADDAVTIAAGIAIGINGAAMGVAYLVENKSRAAPYAALAMTIFGVFTVVFTTVEPFMTAVIGLANLGLPA